MTDTAVLDALMDTLRRNPLTPERLNYPASQFEATDERPFYGRREVVPTDRMNPRYAEVVDRFHQGETVRLERPRRGSCRGCGGEVHAVETKQNGALRVDGKCQECGWELHRAGTIGGE